MIHRLERKHLVVLGEHPIDFGNRRSRQSTDDELCRLIK